MIYCRNNEEVKLEIINNFVEFGIDINQTGDEGINALMYYCRYNKECSFYGAAYCKELQWSNPEECILYKLITDVRVLKNGSN